MEKNTKGIKAFLHDVKAVSPAIATLILIVVAAVAAAAIGILVNHAGSNTGATLDTKTQAVQGQVNIEGSTTIVPIALASAQEFMKSYPQYSITAIGGGSGHGRYLAWTTTRPLVDIGSSSEVWPDSVTTSTTPNLPGRNQAVLGLGDINAKVTETKFGTGMVVVAFNSGSLLGSATALNVSDGTSTVGTSNTPAILNFNDLKNTYDNGSVNTGWTTVFQGGAANTIIYYRNDPAGSGTGDTFMNWLYQPPTGTKKYAAPSGAITVTGLPSNEEIRDAIANCPTGKTCVGFVDQSFTKGSINGRDNVIAASQNGKTAIEANKGINGPYDSASKTVAGVTSTGHGLARDLYYYSNGIPTGAIKAYLDWINTQDGQKIVVAQGFFSP